MTATAVEVPAELVAEIDQAMPSICEVVLADGFPPFTSRHLCGQPAIRRLTVICAHYHIEVVPVCLEHLHVDLPECFCAPCAQGREPHQVHRCPVRAVRYEPIGGPS